MAERRGTTGKRAGPGGSRTGQTPAPPAERAGNGEPPLVLIVDDYADNREMYAQYLRFSGFRVEEASDGFEAIESATRLRPSLIVMDLSLPRLDGWEATRRLKADARTRAIPVVALTGHALAGHSQGAKDAGCDAFVTKPCLPQDLLAAIQRALEARPATTRHK